MGGWVTLATVSQASGGRIAMTIFGASGQKLAVSRPETFYMGETSYFYNLSATYPAARHAVRCQIEWMTPGSG